MKRMQNQAKSVSKRTWREKMTYMKKNWQLYLFFLMPGLLLTIIFKYLPMGGLLIAFEDLYHFFEGTYPYSFARGELYNYDPVTKDARICGTTASLCGIEKGGFEGDLEQVKQGIQRVLMMHAACMSMEGFVMLSSGDEIGQVNDYNYKKNPDTAADSRYLHRSPFQWENAEKRKKPGTVQYAIWNGLKQMEEFRREENCFGETAGISTWDTGNTSVFAIRRTAGREELICLANFSEYGQNAWLNCLEGEYEDLFTGEKLEMNSVWMNPYQYRWCVKK